MEETTDFQDWELLQSSDAARMTAPYPADNPKVSQGIDDDSEDGAIKHDYFALDSEKRHPQRAPSEEESEEGSVDSDNPSWVDPDSDSRYAGQPRGQMGFAGTGFPRKNSGGFWSDDSSDSQRSLAGSEKEDQLGNMGDSITEASFKGTDSGHPNSGGGGEVIKTQHEKSGDLSSGELVKMRDGADSSAHMSAGRGHSNDISPGGGENSGVVWWKMPLELLKFCVFRVRPIWSISIAAAFVGFIMLGRRLHKMKHKSQSISLKIAIDDKKASQLMVRVARLNEAFSVVRRVPIIKSSLPAAGGVTPWPVVSLR